MGKRVGLASAGGENFTFTTADLPAGTERSICEEKPLPIENCTEPKFVVYMVSICTESSPSMKGLTVAAPTEDRLYTMAVGYIFRTVMLKLRREYSVSFSSMGMMEEFKDRERKRERINEIDWKLC